MVDAEAPFQFVFDCSTLKYDISPSGTFLRQDAALRNFLCCVVVSRFIIEKHYQHSVEQ